MRRSERSKVAALLLEEMRTKGMTQHQLAERAGVSQGTISQLINQKRSLSQQTRIKTQRTLRAIASALGQVPTYFERPVQAKTFGQAVRAGRWQKGYSLKDLGALVNISYSTLSLLERDKLPQERILPRWRSDLSRELQLDPQYAVDLLADGEGFIEGEHHAE